jgi:hypothetical protein
VGEVLRRRPEGAGEHWHDRQAAGPGFPEQREGAVVNGAPISPRADRVRYEEARADLRQHYEATGSRDLCEADYRLAHLDEFFGGRRIASIGPADITAYVVKRQSEKAANGTIRRELGTLRRMLGLAYENIKLLRLPVIRKPKEGPPREGFFKRDQYLQEATQRLTGTFSGTFSPSAGKPATQVAIIKGTGG